MHLPAAIGDYTDFYAGIHHATNVGKLFRPDNPLLPNYKYVPIGYHGRASSIVRRAARRCGGRSGQTQAARRARRRASARARSLDYELELGIWIGPGNALGEPIPIGAGAEHIAGFCLLNDWSARDIQAWEYQPLGPFLAKSFHDHASRPGSSRRRRWRRSASRSRRGPPAIRRRCPICSTRDQARGALDIELEVLICTPTMRGASSCRRTACRQATRGNSIGRWRRWWRTTPRRLQPAARRPVRHRHHLGAGRRGLRQPARDSRAAASSRSRCRPARRAASSRTATR